MAEELTCEEVFYLKTWLRELNQLNKNGTTENRDYIKRPKLRGVVLVWRDFVVIENSGSNGSECGHTDKTVNNLFFH